MSNAVELAKKVKADVNDGLSSIDANVATLLCTAVLDLSARVEELTEAGQLLIKAKEYKMLYGKDASYEAQKNLAWAKLANALEAASPAGEKIGEE